jgi:hypothetical protein
VYKIVGPEKSEFMICLQLTMLFKLKTVHVNLFGLLAGEVDYVFGNYDDTERYGISSGLGDQENRDLQTGEIYVRFRVTMLAGFSVRVLCIMT